MKFNKTLRFTWTSVSLFLFAFAFFQNDYEIPIKMENVKMVCSLRFLCVTYWLFAFVWIQLQQTTATAVEGWICSYIMLVMVMVMVRYSIQFFQPNFCFIIEMFMCGFGGIKYQAHSAFQRVSAFMCWWTGVYMLCKLSRQWCRGEISFCDILLLLNNYIIKIIKS